VNVVGLSLEQSLDLTYYIAEEATCARAQATDLMLLHLMLFYVCCQPGTHDITGLTLLLVPLMKLCPHERFEGNTARCSTTLR
jgi:hypothetical protein